MKLISKREAVYQEIKEFELGEKVKYFKKQCKELEEQRDIGRELIDETIVAMQDIGIIQKSKKLCELQRPEYLLAETTRRRLLLVQWLHQHREEQRLKELARDVEKGKAILKKEKKP